MKKRITTETTTGGGKRGLDRRQFVGLSLLTGASATLGLAAPAIAQDARVLRFASQNPVDSIYTQSMVMFANEVAKLSSGKIKVENYPNAELGGGKEMMTAIQLGTTSMGIATPAWYSSIVKQTDVFALPYIVSSADRLRAALDGPFGDKIKTYADGAGLKFVGFWLMGARSIVNNVRPINKPADVAGLKLRVISSPVYLKTFRALGANPVALDPAEIYLAMQQHVIDGFEYPMPDLVDAKMYEVTKYLSLDQHITDFFIVGMNKGIWDSMSAEEQGIVNQAMKKSMDWEWEQQPKNIDAALAKLRGLMTVNDISPADRALFAAATRPVYKDFEDRIGKDLLDQAINLLGPAAPA